MLPRTATASARRLCRELGASPTPGAKAPRRRLQRVPARLPAPPEPVRAAGSPGVPLSAHRRPPRLSAGLSPSCLRVCRLRWEAEQVSWTCRCSQGCWVTGPMVAPTKGQCHPSGSCRRLCWYKGREDVRGGELVVCPFPGCCGGRAVWH